jgi:hypothetical protein
LALATRRFKSTTTRLDPIRLDFFALPAGDTIFLNLKKSKTEKATRLKDYILLVARKFNLVTAMLIHRTGAYVMGQSFNLLYSHLF